MRAFQELWIGGQAEMNVRSACRKVGTAQILMVGPAIPFCAILGRRLVGKVLVWRRLWVSWVWDYGFRSARAIAEIARKNAEKDGILGSNDGKKRKKRVKSRKNRGVLC